VPATNRQRRERTEQTDFRGPAAAAVFAVSSDSISCASADKACTPTPIPNEKPGLSEAEKYFSIRPRGGRNAETVRPPRADPGRSVKRLFPENERKSGHLAETGYRGARILMNA
jgi:hypothetical protein